MLDARIRPHIDPPLAAMARRIVAAGFGADQITIAGAALGCLAAAAVAAGAFLAALCLFLAGRLLDGLDGAVARLTRPTNRGGFLDIALDFVVYAAMPLAFAAHDPAANALPAAALLAGIVVNGAAFLAFAVMAERMKIDTKAQGLKSLYYLGGLAEGSETILFFAAFCLWPAWFGPLALAFAGLCLISGFARIAIGWRLLDR
jgi:phosphatidylglycerophosphate synthase